MTDEFETFWRAYPRRIAKGPARKAFGKAIRLAALDTMLEAIEEYKKHKPGYCDYKHPATWLNSEGWDDEWESDSSTLRVGLAAAVVGQMDAGRGGYSPAGDGRGRADGGKASRPALFLVGNSEATGGNAGDVSDAGQLDADGPDLFTGVV